MDKRTNSVRSVWRRSLVGLLPLLLWVPVSQGQTTAITSSGLNTQVSHGVGQPNYDITGGTRPGNGPNLFHSFGEFSVGASDVARFLNDSGLATTNILSRVTGGNPSNIFGEINTTNFPGANLYLINPAGVLFGAMATLNVSGSVHVSTADYLRLADGLRFNAIPGPQDTLLSQAPVAAFGFLHAYPRPITVQGSQLTVPEGKSLSLVGGDIKVTGGTLTAPGGQINLASLAGRGEARVAPEGIAIAGTTPRGQIMIKGGTEPANVARLDTSGDAGGAVVLRGGKLSLARVEITTKAKAPNQTGGTIVIEATKSATVDSVLLRTGSGWIETSRIRLGGGPVSLTAPSVRASNLTIDTSGHFDGLSGDVAINVRTLTASQLLINDFFGHGPNVSIHATGNVALQNSHIRSFARIIQQDPAQISLRAATLTLTNSFIGSNAAGGGPVGNIVIDVGRLTMKAASIRTDGMDVPLGGGGNISVSAREAILIDGGGVSAAGIGRADGGSITVSTPRLTLNHLGSIATVSDGIRAGDISVNVRTLNMINGGRISTRAFFGGSSSNINIVASQSISMAGVGMDDRGLEVPSGIDSRADGRAGSIHVVTPSMTLSDGALVRATIPASLAQSPIALNVGRLNLLRGASIESSGNGSASIAINAAKSITLDKGSITTFGDESGNVNLHAGGSIQIRNGSRISADNTGQGDGLHVLIQAGKSVSVRDSTVSAGAHQGNGGTIVIDAGQSITLDKGTLTTDVRNHRQNAQSGNVSLIAGQSIQIRNGSRILADTARYVEGDPNDVRQHAGDIVIQAGNSVVSRNSTISAKAQAESGNGGTIVIEAGKHVVSEASTLSVAGLSPAGGDSGQIRVTAGESVLLSKGTVLDATNSGPGGNHAGHIVLNAGKHVIVDASRVIAPVAEGKAGLIEMQAGKDVRLLNGTVVDASASTHTDGGQVLLVAGRNLLVDRSQVKVPVGDGGAAHKIEMHAGNGVWLTREAVLDATGGASDGGQIVIAGKNVVVDDSRLTVDSRSGFFGGPGKVTVVADGFVRLLNGTLVTASAPLSSSGGQVSVTAGDSVLLRNSTIQTFARDSQGGTIALSSETVQLKNGRLVSTSADGTGGTITIKTNNFRRDAASVLDVRGSLGNGAITIEPLP